MKKKANLFRGWLFWFAAPVDNVGGVQGVFSALREGFSEPSHSCIRAV